MRASLRSASISADAQPSSGDGCTGINIRSAASSADRIKLATRGGARVLGRSDIGSLEEGKAADLFLLNMERLEYVGAQFDPKAVLGTVGIARPVDYTIVNGRIVVKEGRIQGLIDEDKVAEVANKLVRQLNNR